MTANEEAIRKAYQVGEEKDVVGWVKCFSKDGPTFFFDPSKKDLSPSLPFRIYAVPLRKRDTL